MNLKQENKTKRKRKDQSKCRIYWRILTVYGYLIDFCNTRNSFFFCYFCAWIPFSRQQSTFHMRQSVVDISILSFCPNNTHTHKHSILIASQPIFAIIILGFESIRFGITSCHHKTIHWILSCSLLVYMCVGSFLNIFFSLLLGICSGKNDYIFVML